MYGDARCARTGTGRWSRRWRWAGCAAVRSSGCGWVICGSGSGAFIAEGKGGHQRVIPVSARFYAEVSSYLEAGRPADPGTDKVFVVLKGPRRGMPLSAEGLDEILDGARSRAGLPHATCHQLRHTCLTQLRKAGMSLEAVQAQAGHASIESTRIYLHLGDDWLASQYRRAAEAIDAQALAVPAMPGAR